MYSNIIVATDGSEIAGRAIAHAIDLAKLSSAKLTAVTVTEPFQVIATETGVGIVPPDDYEEKSKAYAQELLGKVVRDAEAAGVTCDTVHRTDRWPYQAIINAAEDKGGDLIVMGSHGRSGIEGLLLGSQSVKLLTHTKIPALVIR